MGGKKIKDVLLFDYPYIKRIKYNLPLNLLYFLYFSVSHSKSSSPYLLKGNTPYFFWIMFTFINGCLACFTHELIWEGKIIIWEVPLALKSFHFSSFFLRKPLNPITSKLNADIKRKKKINLCSDDILCKKIIARGRGGILINAMDFNQRRNTNNSWMHFLIHFAWSC